MNILFVCRENLQRSPTAEDMLREMAGDSVNVKSAGINRTANKRIDSALLEWTDILYSMMEGIAKRIRNEFRGSLENVKIRVFGIPDRYIRGEPRLKKRLLEEFSQDKFLSTYLDEYDPDEYDISYSPDWFE